MTPCPTCGTDRDATGRHLWKPDPPVHSHRPEILYARGCPACPDLPPGMVNYGDHTRRLGGYQDPRICTICGAGPPKGMEPWYRDGATHYCPLHLPANKRVS